MQETVPILSSHNANKVSRRNWPSAYWLVLKVLCLFHGRKLVTKRVCHFCHLRKLQTERRVVGNTGPFPNYLFPAAVSSPTGWWHEDEGNQVRDENVNEITDDERVENCEVCASMWWDADGERRGYKEEDIGASVWNHRGSFYLSILLLLLYNAFLLYDAAIYLTRFWGKERQLMQLLSYFSYLLSISAVPVICLVANLRNVVPRTRINNFSWVIALHPRYIVRRLQYLRPETCGVIYKPFLFACVIWPFCNSIYRASIYICLVKQHSLHDDITMVTNGIVAHLWGCFCYLVLILRVSIRIQFNRDITFLRKHVGKMDICRKRLGASIHEYGSLSNLCAKWMVLTISLNSIGVATQINWNYIFMSTKLLPSKPSIYHVNLLIWSERIMFVILPLIAVGGLNLQRIWEDFMTRICEIRCDKYHDFWEKIMKFVTREFNPVTNFVELTALFSVLSLYMALEVGDQRANYWANNTINQTNIIPPV